MLNDDVKHLNADPLSAWLAGGHPYHTALHGRIVAVATSLLYL
jgi:hypothetical protein